MDTFNTIITITDKIIIYLHSHHPDILLRPWNASTLLSWYLVANLPLNCSAHLLVLSFSENGCEICCLEHMTIRLVLSFNLLSGKCHIAILSKISTFSDTCNIILTIQADSEKTSTCLGTFLHCSCFSVSHFSIGTFWQSCLTRENHYGMSI